MILALALFFVFAVFLPLAFHLAATIPELLFALVMAVSVLLVVAMVVMTIAVVIVIIMVVSSPAAEGRSTQDQRQAEGGKQSFHCS